MSKKNRSKNHQNQRNGGNYGTSCLNEVVNTFPFAGTQLFLRASPENSKKCNHVEVGYSEDIMLIEMVKYHDHIEIDTGLEIIKDDYENWNNWIDMFENELVQKQGCVFTSMFLKDETELKKLFELKDY
jgi:alpha-L-arabinofuranosidase